MCHFRKRATSVPAEGPAHGLDFASHCEFPLRAPQAQRWHVHGSGTFGAAGVDFPRADLGDRFRQLRSAPPSNEEIRPVPVSGATSRNTFLGIKPLTFLSAKLQIFELGV